jgi:hypothetical protein
MSQVILHHYQLSPYSEKTRLALGLKGLELALGRDPDMDAASQADTDDGRLSTNSNSPSRGRFLTGQTPNLGAPTAAKRTAFPALRRRNRYGQTLAARGVPRPSIQPRQIFLQ